MHRTSRIDHTIGTAERLHSVLPKPIFSPAAEVA
jgi:hypothetical protein